MNEAQNFKLKTNPKNKKKSMFPNFVPIPPRPIPI